MMKLTKRKGFNFFRSYYDVYNELENNKDKVAFIDALLDRQFLGVKPTELTGMAKFAYISQTNSIDSQVKGYEDKTGTQLLNTPTEGGAQGVTEPPTEQEQVKGKEKGQDVQAIIPISLQEFMIYAKTKINNEVEYQSKRDNLILKYENWVENGWRDGFDKPIKRWKAKLLNAIPHIKEKK